jgi:hypothetical protein
MHKQLREKQVSIPLTASVLCLLKGDSHPTQKKQTWFQTGQTKGSSERLQVGLVSFGLLPVGTQNLDWQIPEILFEDNCRKKH